MDSEILEGRVTVEYTVHQNSPFFDFQTAVYKASQQNVEDFAHDAIRRYPTAVEVTLNIGNSRIAWTKQKQGRWLVASNGVWAEWDCSITAV